MTKAPKDLLSLEQKVAQDVAHLAHLLRALPLDQDHTAIAYALEALTLSRRKLATRVKSGMKATAHSSTTTDRTRRTAFKAFSDAQKRLRIWRRLEPLVLAQINPAPRDLIDHTQSNDIGSDTFEQVITLSLNALHRLANPVAATQSDDAQDQGLHRDIPLPMGQFSKMLSAAYRLCLAQRKPHPLRFLDVGSGGGTKVLAASTAFDLCHGLEYEAHTVETGKTFLSLLSPNRCSIAQGDALTYSDYGQWDAIYFYRPLVENEAMNALEMRILDQAAPGTVILTVGGSSLPDPAAHGLHRMDEGVYVTGLPHAASTTLRQNAERLGTMIPGISRRGLVNPGYWGPLRDACAQNGYVVS